MRSVQERNAQRTWVSFRQTVAVSVIRARVAQSELTLARPAPERAVIMTLSRAVRTCAAHTARVRNWAVLDPGGLRRTREGWSAASSDDGHDRLRLCFRERLMGCCEWSCCSFALWWAGRLGPLQWPRLLPVLSAGPPKWPIFVAEGLNQATVALLLVSVLCVELELFEWEGFKAARLIKPAIARLLERLVAACLRGDDELQLPQLLENH